MTTRIWAVYHPNATATPGVEHLESFPSLGAATAELSERLRTGQGTRAYAHPDENRSCAPFDPTSAFAHIWLSTDLPHQGEPDVTTHPHEMWMCGPRGGLHRRIL